jgi:hypothetical protein
VRYSRIWATSPTIWSTCEKAKVSRSCLEIPVTEEASSFSVVERGEAGCEAGYDAGYELLASHVEGLCCSIMVKQSIVGWRQVSEAGPCQREGPSVSVAGGGGMG